MDHQTELRHFGVKGMKWGVRKASYDEKQAATGAKANAFRARAQAVRSEKPNNAWNRGVARKLERKADSQDVRAITRKNLHETVGAVKGLASGGVNRKNLAAFSNANRGYSQAMAKKYTEIADRTRNEKGFVNLYRTKRFDQAASLESFQARRSGRNSQRIMKQPVDKMTSADKKIYTEAFISTAAVIGLSALSNRD